MKFILTATFSKNVAIVILIVVSALLFFVPATQTSAQVGIPTAGVDLDGYAWSSTIGWVSMNCLTGGATGNNICATSNYKVTLNSSGTLTGYAWSSNIGWVRFGGLIGFPVFAGTEAANARVTGNYATNLTFEGWARACAGTLNGDCVSMANSTTSGGWDGWTSLRQTTGTLSHSIVMTSAGGTADSYAWGSTVIGWLNFDQVVYLTPSASINGTGCGNIPVGGSTCTGSVTWNITNASSPNVLNSTRNPDGPNDYNVAIGTNQPITLRADIGGNVIRARNGSASIISVTLTASCVTGADFSNGATCQLTPVPPPVITITTNKKIARVGETVTVSWTIVPPTTGISCTPTGPGLSGPITATGNQTSNPLRSKTRFSLSCTGAFVPSPVGTSTVVEIIPVASEV